jgi:uncharacterized protein YecE (DUF72 family)
MASSGAVRSRDAAHSRGRAYVGISGWDYPRWRGVFYPPELPRRRWLEHAAARFDSVELNGTFYSLKRPEHFRRWAEAAPEGFVFAVKGSRYITHFKKIDDVDAALANFFASGVLALGAKLGPLLWQLPAALPFEPARVERFLARLPRDTDAAARLARGHDARLEGRAFTERLHRAPLRHALEPRHPSYFRDASYEILAAHDVALVMADTAGRWPTHDVATASFAYVRLHGSTELYASGYTDRELDAWAERVAGCCDRVGDAYVYFDNDAKAHAPGDALRLMQRLEPLRAAIGR